MERLTTKILNPITHKTEICLNLGVNYERLVEKLAEYEDLEEQGKLLKHVDLLINRIREKYSKELGAPNNIWYNHGISVSIDEIERELRCDSSEVS